VEQARQRAKTAAAKVKPQAAPDWTRARRSSHLKPSPRPSTYACSPNRTAKIRRTEKAPTLS